MSEDDVQVELGAIKKQLDACRKQLDGVTARYVRLARYRVEDRANLEAFGRDLAFMRKALNDLDEIVVRGTVEIGRTISP